MIRADANRASPCILPGALPVSKVTLSFQNSELKEEKLTLQMQKANHTTFFYSGEKSGSFVHFKEFFQTSQLV